MSRSNSNRNSNNDATNSNTPSLTEITLSPAGTLTATFETGEMDATRVARLRDRLIARTSNPEDAALIATILNRAAASVSEATPEERQEMGRVTVATQVTAPTSAANPRATSLNNSERRPSRRG